MQSRSTIAKTASTVLCMGLLLYAGAVSEAQQVLQLGTAQPFGAGVAAIIAESVPRDDEVLVQAPEQIDLLFPQRVRLVKLALYNEKRDWVDIGFRYDPKGGTRFVWPVPSLTPAEYYTADWAILGDDQLLQRGSFSFSFGPGAEKPSEIRQRNALLLELQNLPNQLQLEQMEQLEQLGLDPAEIIINNQSPRVFEPPFAPVLD
ncbi:MAG: hypothetical protein RLZZ385_1040 [Pseudomonadota bacterium]|jgi:methionine-rich copper-binding protein CopC